MEIPSNHADAYSDADGGLKFELATVLSSDDSSSNVAQYSWDEEDAKSYFASMGAQVIFEVIPWRPWVSKIELSTSKLQFDFDSTVELWDWWRYRTIEVMSRELWEKEIISYFRTASEKTRHLMKVWANSPDDVGWTPESAGLRGENTHYVQFQMPLNWREEMAMRTPVNNWVENHTPLNDLFSWVERQELEEKLPAVAGDCTSLTCRL